MRVLILLFLLIPSAAAGGTRATYAIERSAPVVIEIADNGDFAAQLQRSRRLVVRSGEAFLVEERLTGPVVMRVADLAAVLAARARRSRQRGPRFEARRPVPRGLTQVNGRTGRLFEVDGVEERPGDRRADAVISDDPALAPLGRAMRTILAAEAVAAQLDWQLPSGLAEEHRNWMALLDRGAPLRFLGWTLRSVELAPISADGMALPAEPETADALRARLAAEGREENDAEAADRMILRAAFAAGRLWLLADRGTLSSLAEGESARTRHDLGEPVLDICAAGGTLIALTGTAEGAEWKVRRLEGGRWTSSRSIPRAADRPTTLSCGEAGEMLLTDRRLIDLRGAGAAPLALSEPLERAALRAVVHVARDAVYVGFNAGEWGGGMQRIDRRTGRVAAIERNATGGLCDGPLNTSCDPVNGIATIPWRPDCVAAAVGLIHMMAHGRIVRICPDGIEQMISAADDIDPEDEDAVRQAARGSYGSVAFFGIETSGDSLIAVGHNGLHRIRADGSATHQRWPRFVEVDGVFLSFALPDVVLVLTQLNRRASVSGSSPLLVPR